MPLPGGSADKLGNRYELWWTVAQLERMLHGEINSIRIEDPGVDKAEFVARVGGHQELHQSKRSHPSGKWSVASLAGADVGVLQAIFGQLRGNRDEFVFVSESHAGELAELAIRARGGQTAQEFATTFLQAKDASENYSPSFERTLDGYKLAGHARFTLLSAIPRDLRSTSANARYEEIERKFKKPDEAAVSVKWWKSNEVITS